MRLRSCSLAIGLLAGAASFAADWSEFRGPHRSGQLDGTDFPVVFGPSTNLGWSVEIPSGHSSPVLADSKIFLTAFHHDRLLVLAHALADGAPLWQFPVEPGSIEAGSRLSHPATATPVTDGSRIWAYFAPFGLLCLDLDGRELWRHPLPTPVTQHGASSSPVLAGDLVLQLCDQDVGSYLLALDRHTGRERWKTPRPTSRRGFSTPLPWPPQQPTQLLVAGTLRLTAYSLHDGRPLWNVDGLPNEMVASPIPDAHRVVVAGWTPGSGVPRMPEWTDLASRGDANHDGFLERSEIPSGPARQHFHYIDASRDGRLDRTEYETIAGIFNASRNAAFSFSPPSADSSKPVPQVHWTQDRGLPYVPTPLAYQGRIYLVKNGGLLSCLDAATGTVHFREERIGALGDYYSSPIAAAGKLLMISQAGLAVVLRAGNSLEILARNDLEEQVLATPALAHHTLLVRTASRLYAFRDLQAEPLQSGAKEGRH